MSKCKYRKILAMILAASLTFQCMPSAVFASEKTDQAVSQNDEAKDAEQKTEQKQEPQQSDESQTNVPSATEEQTQTEAKTEQEPQTETEQESEEADTDSQSLVVNGKVAINSSDDFINLSKEYAGNYQNAEITITRGAGVAFDLTK